MQLKIVKVTLPLSSDSIVNLPERWEPLNEVKMNPKTGMVELFVVYSWDYEGNHEELEPSGTIRHRVLMVYTGQTVEPPADRQDIRFQGVVGPYPDGRYLSILIFGASEPPVEETVV